ncbi:MAG: hypothetical protein JWO30_4627 [Fibrobacteres bacterium]|nr:hypothetical protein [Fibrobacterota bacterium]
MQIQNYATHRRYPIRRYYLPVTASLVFFGALANLCCPEILGGRLTAILPVLTGGALLLGWFNSSVMVHKVQDRAIRAEENFRHYLLTGKPLPDGLGKGQIVALRFASNEEFPELAARAVAEKLRGEAIKKSIKQWRPDTYRA